VVASPPSLASSAAISLPPAGPALRPPLPPSSPDPFLPPAAPPNAAAIARPSALAQVPVGSPEVVPPGFPTQDSISIPDPRQALIGAIVDGFAIDAILGSGGCGTVYRGRQLGLDRPVAIKVPTFDVVDDPVLKKRFLREARAAARVRHPSVVTIYGVGEVSDGRPYLAMELLEGVSLMQVLDDGPLETDRALALARQIALALAETHAAGVVHRDLKPSNIIWRKDRNGEDRITIVDFGIAAGQQGSADATRLTAGGKVIGTPHYMAPEQAQGELQDVDHRTDLYALGCLLFELLTNEVPFDGTGFEVVLAHMAKQPQPPSARLTSIPREVDELVLQLMKKRPQERPHSAEELVARIDALRALGAARGGADRTEPSIPMGLTAREPGGDSEWGSGDSGGDGSVVGAASTMLAAAGIATRGAPSLPQLSPPSRSTPASAGSQQQLWERGAAAQRSTRGSAPPRPAEEHGSQPNQGAHGPARQHHAHGSALQPVGLGGSQATHGSSQSSQPQPGPARPRRPTHALNSAALTRRYVDWRR
jgi:serine/threonine protein kinase